MPAPAHTPRTDGNAQYWHLLMDWIESQPHAIRVQMIQACVQEKGPAPDELGDRVRAALATLNA